MYDANAVLQALVTKTTDFNGAGFDLKTGTPRRGLKARVIVTSYISADTAGSTFLFTIEHSDDDTTYTVLSTGTTLTGGTAAATNEQWLPFETSKRYVRCSMNIGTTAGTPSISYLCDIGEARP